jgi:proline dehydrogenase
MLGPLILGLSRSGTAARATRSVPGVRGFARRFVAGERTDDAVRVVRELNGRGFEASVSYLGEEVTDAEAVAAALAELTSFARAVRAEALRSHVSVKLTQLGLSFDRALAQRALDAVLTEAAEAETFVRIDMEDSRYTEVTLDIFRAAQATHRNVGAVIQSYLRRSEDDVVALARNGAPVRLVKGAYREPPDVAYPSRREVDGSYVRLVDAYLREMAEGAWLAVATHDPAMIRATLEAVRRHGVSRERFEFQMLYGIRTDLQRRLRDAGHRVRVYVPYGGDWYPYLMRRLAERPANLWFFVRNALRLPGR